jgi:hypothetical protein
VVQRRRRVALRPALELLHRRRRLLEQRAHRRELGLVREVRRGCDRKVARVQVVACARERQRLQRLRRRAHERHELRIAGLGDHRAVLHRDGVHAVDRLDKPRRGARIHLNGSMRLSLKRPRSGLWSHPDFMSCGPGRRSASSARPSRRSRSRGSRVKNLNESAFAVASLTTVHFLPFLLFTLPAGVWVDRLSRRMVLIVGDLGRAVLLLTIPARVCLRRAEP